MRLTMVMLIVTLMNLSASTYSQNKNVSLKLKNATIEEALKQIQTDLGIDIYFQTEMIPQGSTVDFETQSATVAEIMDAVLKDTGLTYRMIDDNMVIVPRQSTVNTSAQQGLTVSGTVTDVNGEPLPGVTVSIEGTTTGTITGIDGTYSLQNVEEGSVLLYSFIGFETQTISVAGRTSIDVTLVEEVTDLNEVVVVGYGTQKKVNTTGAVTQVKMDEVLGDRPVTGIGAILQGTMPGFTSSTSARPGGGNDFNIRGMESINGGSPLILVDNVVYNDFKLINPDDIESVSVLKDAASAAIYGARAAFGVILITTKQGKRNEKVSISYNNNFAVSSVNNLPEYASPTDFIQTLKDGEYSSIWSGQNIDTYLDLLQDYSSNPQDYPLGWTDDGGTKYFLKETGYYENSFEPSFKQIHNVSVKGGSKTINYRISLGYLDEDGILVNNKDAFTRTSVSSYVNGDITSWLSTSLDVKFNKGIQKYPFIDGSSELRLWKANVPSFHPEGMLPYGTDGEEYPVYTTENIVNLADVSKNVTRNTRIFSKTELKPFKGLKAILEYSYQMGLTDYESYANYFEVHQGVLENIKPSTKANPFTSRRSSTEYTSLNAYLSYNKSFNSVHNISGVAGFNQEESDYRYLNARAFNMISNELPSLVGTDGLTPPEATDAYSDFALRGGFFRFNYNYKEKYLIEFNGRYDLSSKFPTDTRSGFFPSVSAAWNIARESFMQPTEDFITTLKLRASYGSLGNQSVPNYGYLPDMPITSSTWLYNGLLPQTMGSMPMVRANYTWEEVNTINGGVDFGAFNNRLTGSFDIYTRKTLGMLGPVEQLPAVAGAAAPRQNAADMETNGWELAMNWKGKAGAVKYSLGFNIYDSRSVITRYKNETKLLSSPYYVGKEIGEIWGYVTDGFYTESDFDANGILNDDVTSIRGVVSSEGDIKFKNLMDDDNSVNEINSGDNTATNPGDRKIIGNSRARYQYGANGSLNWKNFGFSFLLQGVGKRDAWIGGNFVFPMSGQFSTVYADQVGKIWTPDNKENAFYGRIYENGGQSQESNQRVSDKFLSNAAYLRVKNITLSYSLPKQILSKVKINNAKIFVSGENLLTFDKLPSGIDVQNLNWNYPQFRTISFGVNLNL
ncbi:SusC/RagA family TonB-linked outer membrane protein [Carboxylicivirga marina]|uniref:SusC/RagA family TonB-linked outer membrane protein n=1 Tax=Carboxylicivirga marina TaxID=2800988 RepID=UPI002592D6A6|nr:SusC/RagA family TonB-linked outer membrane protein [uncultured Carboxylicivirga sp.]